MSVSGIKTLADRARERGERLSAALATLDRELAVYARREGGRFIRYGSTATGRAQAHSDVDIIADFADDERCLAACRFADYACLDRSLKPDVRPVQWSSPKIIARALEEGRILS
mgnify:CR=1 FL=1